MAKEHPFGEQGLYVPVSHTAGGMIPLPGSRGSISQGTATRMVSHMTRNLVRLATPTSQGGFATDEDIEAGENWYPTGHEHARRLSSMLGSDHRVASALISSLSPQTEWEQNLIKAHDIARHGRPTSEMAGWGEEHIGANPEFSTDPRIRKAHAILNHAQMGGAGDGRFNIIMRGTFKGGGFKEPESRPVFEKGLKTHSFMENIHDPSNPDFVTIDTHAHNAAVASRTPSDSTGLGTVGRYNLFAQAYHGASQHIGVAPPELQARVWTTWKRMNPMSGGRNFDDYLKQTGQFDDYYSR
jgi:hypothetical protein